VAVYNWVEFYFGAVGFRQHCDTCLYDGCGRIPVADFNNDEKSNDEYAQKLLASCWALRGLSKQLALKNVKAANLELFSTYQFRDPDDGKIKLHIGSAGVDTISVTPCHGYLNIRIIDVCGRCEKDCTGRRRRSKKQKLKFNPGCVKFAVWNKFAQKMMG
jgi:hypothetical protein